MVTEVATNTTSENAFMMIVKEKSDVNAEYGNEYSRSTAL
jgi:hypothetical protein